MKNEFTGLGCLSLIGAGFAILAILLFIAGIQPSAPRKAIVSLLGPVPGILIGVLTGFAYLRTPEPILADATRTFLFINTFNLLPFHPLDGGRFFDAVLFSRHPKLEIGFKILTALLYVLHTARHRFLIPF